MARMRHGRYGRKDRRNNCVLILLGIGLLVAVLMIGLYETVRKGPVGEYLTLEEAENMTWLLADTAGMTVGFLQRSEDGTGEYLEYAQWKRIAGVFSECGYDLPDDYRNQDPVLAKDWYAFWDAAVSVYDRNDRIRNREITVLGIGDAVKNREGIHLAGEELLAEDDVYAFRSSRLKTALYQKVTAVERDGILYALRSVWNEAWSLSNVWVMGEEQDGIRFFREEHEVLISWERIPERLEKVKQEGEQSDKRDMFREQVADLHFENGKLTAADVKREKISGKLLKVTEQEIELEGMQPLPIAQDFAVYRIYGTLKTENAADLLIGYDVTDFVIRDGQIHAALVTREESMETIRVLIRTSDYEEMLHHVLELSADCDLLLTALSQKTELGSITWPAGETLRIEASGELLDGGRLLLEPKANTGRITIHNLTRSHGAPSYRGVLELERQDGGILAVNELLLEEYLYAVVPSEMPAAYPLEALKAQAVCARTYAYQRILHAGLPAYGAHVDDSSAFQVYHNVSEQTETSRAVRETKGELLAVGEELAQTYYYSTSCGYGSDPSVWSDSDGESFSYLRSKAVNVAGVTDAEGDTIDSQVSMEEIADAANMQMGSDFSAFIRSRRETDFESDNPWYRWTYRVREIDTARMYEMLKERYRANPRLILTRTESGWENREPADPGKLLSMEILSRGEGGIVRELLIEGENNTFLVKTEYNIRTILNDGKSEVIRQDGSTYFSGSLLPSAFFDLEPELKQNTLSGYTLYGGGFGHGVGMSQNGAKSMAEKGCDAETILEFFYEGSRVRSVY